MKKELAPGDEVEDVAQAGRLGVVLNISEVYSETYKSCSLEYLIKWSDGLVTAGIPAICGACYRKNPHHFHAVHYRRYKCPECQEAGLLASWEGCYLCRKDSDDLDRCQDCGEQYCDGCFHTPCHDLCSSGREEFHFRSSGCPHWKSLKSA